jgi:hypothetical protein
MLTQIEKHLLHVIESYADNETGEAWPGAQRLADDMGVPRRTVEKKLVSVRGKNWLAYQSGTSPDRTNLYKVTPVPGDARPERRDRRADPRPRIGGKTPNPRPSDGGTPGPGSDKLPRELPRGTDPTLPPPDPWADDLPDAGPPEPPPVWRARATITAPCIVTRWTGLCDVCPGPKAEIGEWPAMLDALSTPLDVYAGEKKHPGWSPASFATNVRGAEIECKRRSCARHRHHENVRDVSALVLDYDNKDGSNITLDRAAEIWRDRLGLVHTSKSHSPTAPRWRVVLVLSRLVTSEEHTRIWTWAERTMKSFGVVLDPSPSDASRFWFWPCRASGGHFEARRLNGEPLPVDALLRHLDVTGPKDTPNAKSQSAGPAPSNDVEYALAALRRECEAVERAPRGERNPTVARAAYALGGFTARGLLDVVEVGNALREATRRGGWDRSEERRTNTTISRQLRAGARRPRVVPDRPPPAARTAGRG